MPSLTWEEVQKFSPFKTELFIETGTFMGDTVCNMKHYFNTLYSVEVNEHYANGAMERFKNDKHVFIIHGDSSQVLLPLCKSINSPAFFWLDGHWSGGDTGKGEKDCPLLEELEHIYLHCNEQCIIAIDDARLFGTKVNEDWTTITEQNVLAILQGRIESYRYYPSHLDANDRLVIVLKKGWT